MLVDDKSLLHVLRVKAPRLLKVLKPAGLHGRFYDCPSLIECENAFPVVFHVHYGPFVQYRGGQRLIEPAEMRLTVIGIFTFGIGVMDDQTEPYAAAHGGPL